MSIVKIGGGQGFWGDSPDAAIHMAKTADLDYIACDYLAELTMSILARQKMKNPEAGYARDFIGLYDACAEDAWRKNIGILTNAGGMNIEKCADAVVNVARKHGLNGLKVGCVLGDDLTDKIDELYARGVTFENMDGVGDFKDIKDKIVNANVYFGHEPTVEALEAGANVVITGRSTDSALFLAPIMHKWVGRQMTGTTWPVALWQVICLSAAVRVPVETTTMIGVVFHAWMSWDSRSLRSLITISLLPRLLTAAVLSASRAAKSSSSMRFTILQTT